MTQRLIGLCGKRPSWRSTRAWLLAPHCLKHENVVRDRSPDETQHAVARLLSVIRAKEVSWQTYASSLRHCLPLLSAASRSMGVWHFSSARVSTSSGRCLLVLVTQFSVYLASDLPFRRSVVHRSGCRHQKVFDDCSQLSLRADDVAGE